jgi:phosphate starvation-inducible PhoH-like protein
LTEKLIQLKDVTLVDFLGIENNYIRALAAAFPESKIISRGDEIHIKGSAEIVKRIYDILHALLAHYHQHELLTEEVIQHYVKEEGRKPIPEAKKAGIIYSARGVLIKPRTSNQEKLVAAAAGKHDMIFAIGPAGTGKTYTAVALAIRALKNKQSKRLY